jgi:hypothetical protein
MLPEANRQVGVEGINEGEGKGGKNPLLVPFSHPFVTRGLSFSYSFWLFSD